MQQLTFENMLQIGKIFAESGMFADAKTAAQAIVKIQAGHEIGIPPFAAMSGIHIIQGKPTMGAGLMASIVKGSGKYDYKVVEMDDKKCSIDFYQGSEKIGNSTFTADDAKKAQTKNLEKFPKNMLFARAMSNGAKWFCPDVFAGPVYVSEEMQAEDIAHEEIKQQTSQVTQTSIAPPVKKVISNAQITTAIKRIENGEVDIAAKVRDTYSLSPEQLAKIADSETRGEELKSAIDSLPIATTEAELMDLKQQLPAYIVDNASFITAAGARLEVIMATPA